jgi:hypothetical protein
MGSKKRAHARKKARKAKPQHPFTPSEMMELKEVARNHPAAQAQSDPVFTLSSVVLQPPAEGKKYLPILTRAFGNRMAVVPLQVDDTPE